MRSLDEGLWDIAKSNKMLGIELGMRATVVRLRDGSLFVHSPVRLSSRTKYALDKVGSVGHVVAPNLFHHAHIAPYFAAYPRARFYAAPGLVKKREDLKFHETLSARPAPAWAGDLDQCVIKGVPGLNEVVFFHHASGSLIVSDLVFNLPVANGLWENVFKTLNRMKGRCGPTRHFRSYVKDPGDLKRSIEKILSWHPERLIMAHGEVIDKGVTRILREGFLWVLERPDKNPKSLLDKI